MTTPNISSYVLSNMKPAERLPIWKWAEKYIYLSVRQATGFPGLYRTALTPYVRGIFDAFQDPNLFMITVEKGAQTGLTLVGYIWLAHAIAEDPGPVLLVYPTEDLARSASETRMMPMIEDTPMLKDEMSDNRDEWTKLQYVMKRCTVNWVGSNSPANLASRAIRYLMEDETDKYPMKSQTEASPISLAEQRTKTFWNRKIYKISTPTVPEGVIHASYLDGDQRRYFVPCHKCGMMQFLKWSQVKFDSKLTREEIKKSVRYECEVCGAHWNDVHKNAAVSKGEWRATAATKTEGHASFHISSLYAPWTKFADLAIKFLSVKDRGHLLQDFVNSELGEPFLHYENSIKDSIFNELEGQYLEGQLWANEKIYASQYEGDKYVLAGVDVQKGYLVAAFRQFCVGGDSGLVWGGTVSGFEALEELANKFTAQYILVDSRYRTQEVNEWCSRHTGYIPTQGVVRKAKTMFTVNHIDIHEGKAGQGKSEAIEMITYDADMLKDLLADMIQRRQGARRWLVPQGYAIRTDYCDQMTSEKNINGKWQPIPAGRANHFWDAECLALLAAVRFQVWMARDEIQEEKKE